MRTSRPRWLALVATSLALGHCSVSAQSANGAASAGNTIRLHAQGGDYPENLPRELVGIVKEDPKVLDSFESFLVALRGPR